MAVLTSGTPISLDLFETAIGSALTPSFALVSNSEVQATFEGGFIDNLKGVDLSIDNSGTLVGGTITEVAEYRNGALSFSLSGISIPATNLSDWFATADYSAFFASALSGADVITGSQMNDRLFGGDGNDTLIAGDGDDELAGDDGDDVLTGGAGENWLDGGAGLDTAKFNALFRTVEIGGSEDGTTVNTPISVDTVANIERLIFLDGTLVLDESASYAKISRLYLSVLNRKPDIAGLTFYVSQMEDRNASLVSVASDLTGSSEFKAATGNLTNAQFVDYIYQHALGRDPDPTGSIFYTKALDAGMSRGAFVVDLSESVEHRETTFALTSGGFFKADSSYQSIALLYDSFFNRLPDQGGLIYYAEAVKTGAASIAQVAADFAGSGEFQAGIHNKTHMEIVQLVYENTLHRAPDSSGAAFYSTMLDHGMSVAAFVSDLAFSQEHFNYMSARIMNGIETG